jgi:hypothetical protein
MVSRLGRFRVLKLISLGSCGGDVVGIRLLTDVGDGD